MIIVHLFTLVNSFTINQSVHPKSCHTARNVHDQVVGINASHTEKELGELNRQDDAYEQHKYTFSRFEAFGQIRQKKSEGKYEHRISEEIPYIQGCISSHDYLLYIVNYSTQRYEVVAGFKVLDDTESAISSVTDKEQPQSKKGV